MVKLSCLLYKFLLGFLWLQVSLPLRDLKQSLNLELSEKTRPIKSFERQVNSGKPGDKCN